MQRRQPTMQERNRATNKHKNTYTGEGIPGMVAARLPDRAAVILWRTMTSRKPTRGMKTSTDMKTALGVLNGASIAAQRKCAQGRDETEDTRAAGTAANANWNDKASRERRRKPQSQENTGSKNWEAIGGRADGEQKGRNEAEWTHARACRW